MNGVLMKALLFLILLCICTHTEASATELHLGRFSTNDMTGWKEQTIGLLKSKTTYSLSWDSDRVVLVAHSTKSASGRIYTTNLDPKEYSTLKWSWKVDHTIKKGDEKTKAGDDFAARVCVFFPRGFFSKTRLVCYVWANKLHKGDHVVSPFTTNIITVAADSGEELVGRWAFHQQNILDDYRRFFGEEPPRIGAVALMTDTDNTGETAVGYYGDISLARSAKIIEVKQKDQKTKDHLPKGIKNNDAISLPSSDIQQLDKSAVDPKQREPDIKEQSDDTLKTPPATAPQTLLQR
jgi:hypothetical protein